MAPKGTKRARKTNSWSWWDEVEILEQQSQSGGGAKRWTCRYCNITKHSGVNRIRGHLIHEPGQEIHPCLSIPLEKRRELEAKHNQVIFRAPPPRSIATNPSFFTSPSQPHSQPGNFAASIGSSSVHQPPPRGQRTLDSSWDPRKKEVVDAAVARFFYHDHIAFNVARSPYFREMVRLIAEFGPTYTPPSSESLRTTHLEKEKQAINQALLNVKEGWRKNGVSIISDGWSDSRSRSIHGIMAYSRGNTFFMTSHDASDTGKYAEVIVKEWTQAIEHVGAQDVIQVIGDGEASNRAAGDLLLQRYPHITFTPCIAHGLNNLLKDIDALSWVAPCITKGKEIVTFITRHTFSLSQFRKRSPNHDLLKYSDTRFAYNFLMLDRLLCVHNILKQLVVSDEWVEWGTSKSTQGKECYKHIYDNELWDEIKHVVDITKPIIHMLRIVDSKKPCIGKVYEGIDKMVERIKSQETDDNTKEELRALCQKRWDQYHSPMHAAAFVLDPAFQGNGQETDEEVSNGWDLILERLVTDPAQRRKIRTDLAKYRSKSGKFGSADAQRDREEVGGALWWEDYGAHCPELQRLAIRILSQNASSSCIEQLWSVFSHVASKKRNRLQTTRTNNLVYVAANLRLLAQIASGEQESESFISMEPPSDSDEDQDNAPPSTITNSTLEEDIAYVLAPL